MGSSSANEDLFDVEFLERLRALFLRLRKRRQLRKKGIQNTPATGFTREFKDFRHYTHRDDYRSIDWRLYARLDRLFIRLYEEVQEFHLHILVDTSGSMVEPFPEKRAVSLKLAVALSYLGLIGQHRVSLYSMSDTISAALPPLKGPGNIQRVIEFARGLEFGGVTNLERCFGDFRPSRRRYGILFVISDLYGKGIEEARGAIRHASTWPGEVHLIQVVHPWEEDPDIEGEIELVDVETGEQRRFWFTPGDRARYAENYRRFVEGIAKESRGRQVDHQAWRTDSPFEEEFLELLTRGSALASG